MMLRKYLQSLSTNKLATLLYKADKQFWHWANVYYNGNRNPDAGYVMERWRRMCDLIYDEMRSEERVLNP